MNNCNDPVLESGSSHLDGDDLINLDESSLI